MATVLSVYVPIISEKASESYIKKMFRDNEIGKVMRVDFVKNINKDRREAFIHFDEWFTNSKAISLKNDILDISTKTRFVYNNNGKYWPLLPNKNAHKRVDNPDYEVLKTENVKIIDNNSLNVTTRNNSKSLSKKVKLVAKEPGQAKDENEPTDPSQAKDENEPTEPGQSKD